MTALPLFNYPLTIAMVDDDPLVLQAVTHMLAENYFHKTFNNVNDGLNFFKNYTPLLPSTNFLRGRVMKR